MQAAVISRQGLGDGLMMMICAHHLKQEGYHVDFFHNALGDLSDFFPDVNFRKIPHDIQSFDIYDLIIIEHYESQIIKNLIKIKKNNIFVIYPTLNTKKSPQIRLSSINFICDKNQSMAQNILAITSKILNKKDLQKTNGIKIPPELSYRKYKNRVVIHPVSNNAKKNWSSKKFIALCRILRKNSLNPVFSIASHESNNVQKLKKSSLKIEIFKHFKDLAAYVYESGWLIGNDSGPAHLASNLNIPTLVIAANPTKMKLWRPDFYPAKVLTAPAFIPNLKNLRLRDKYWSSFISTKKAYDVFSLLK